MEYMRIVSLLSIVIVLMTVEQASTEPLMFAATCDDNLEFYADGDLIASSHGISDVATFEVTFCPSVAAVYCEDVGVAGGIMASFGNSQVSYVTDVSWVCLATADRPPAGWNTAGFDDSTWASAVVLPDRFFRVTLPEISDEADWIWSTTSIGLHRKVYCRKSIPDCGDIEAESTSTTEQTTQIQTTTESPTSNTQPLPTTADVEAFNCNSRNPCVHFLNSNYRPYFPHETAGRFIWCTPAGDCHLIRCSAGNCPRIDLTGKPPETHQSGSYTCQQNNPCDPSVNQSTFPHEDPTKLIHCGQGTDCFELSCTPGLLWDQIHKTCSYP